MQIDMRGRQALVTGGSSGIGRAIAAALVEAGAQVAVTGRREEELRAAAEEVGAVAVPGDVRDRAHAEAAVRTCVERFGGLSTLVNSAGVIGGATTAETSPRSARPARAARC